MPCLLLRCNELDRYAVHGACSTVSLFHARGMLAHHLYGSRHSCWQVLSAQRRPDDLIDLGCRCSALLLAPPRCCLQQSTDPIARCAWQAVSRPVRRVHHMLRLGRASRSSPSERQASACNPHLHLCSRRLCCARVRRMQKVTTLVCWQVRGVGLRRAGGRALALPEQPGQAGLHVSRFCGRACRSHACTLVCPVRAAVDARTPHGTRLVRRVWLVGCGKMLVILPMHHNKHAPTDFAV